MPWNPSETLLGGTQTQCVLDVTLSVCWLNGRLHSSPSAAGGCDDSHGAGAERLVLAGVSQISGPLRGPDFHIGPRQAQTRASAPRGRLPDSWCRRNRVSLVAHPGSRWPVTVHPEMAANRYVYPAPGQVYEAQNCLSLTQ